MKNWRICMTIRHFIVLNVPSLLEAACRWSVWRMLSGGHVPFMFVSPQGDGMILLLFNLRLEALCYYISKCGGNNFLFCKLGKDSLECCKWVLQGKEYVCRPKTNPFALSSKHSLNVQPYLLFVEKANCIIRANLEPMSVDLQKDAHGILAMADDGVGITPWYYRGRLYKGLFEKKYTKRVTIKD